MGYINIDGKRFFYRLEGAGAPVLLIHGVGGDHTGFDGVVRERLLRRHQVITMDLRGHGRSTRAGASYSTALFARDVNAILRSLRVPPAAVLGISMGGAIAMKLAARHPARVSRLVLVDTWCRCDEAARACFHEWIAASRRDEQVLRDIVLVRTATPQFMKRNPSFRRLFDRVWPSASGAAFRKSCLACADHDATADLGRITAPTLVLTGSRDILVPSALGREVAAGIRGAKFRIIEGGGHVPWLDAPERFMGVVSRFLRG